MDDFRYYLKRPFLLILAITWVCMYVLFVNRIWAFRAEFETHITNELESQIRERVNRWEESQQVQLNQWLDIAAVEPSSAASVQRQFLKRSDSFDSLYLWVPRREVRIGGQTHPISATFLFPSYPPTENTEQLISHPCLLRAQRLALQPEATPLRVAHQFIKGCKATSLPTRIIAASDAASVLAKAGYFEKALVALNSTGVRPSLELNAGIQQGLVPERLVILRTQRAQLLMALGRRHEALNLLVKTGHEIASLEAPSASSVLSYLTWPILSQLEESGQVDDVKALTHAFERAERRVHAWREIAERILPRPPLQPNDPPRVIYDQYADVPFLLYYGPKRNGQLGAAIALNQPEIIEDFFQHMGRYHRYLSLTDEQNEVVAGAASEGPFPIQIPFKKILPHLQVSVQTAAIKNEIARNPNQWLSPLIGSNIIVILGLWLIHAQLLAQRNQELLLIRQREFTTRVTHELKTPIAGIRIMAENIEMRICKTEEEQRQMAQRIIDEADRLTLRVNEVLEVAKEQSLPDPEPVDPEEVALDCIDQWGPRFESLHIGFAAELDITPEVMGHYRSIRDAVACLLDNAIKYHNPAHETPMVWFNLRERKGWIEFEIKDNGLGVPPAMRKKIFEQFVRVEGPNRGKSGGYGLGLSQVTRIAKAHHGEVFCDTGAEGGARFVFRLPPIV